VSIAVWPIEAAQLKRWLNQKLGEHGLQAENDAIELIAERVEGNMLAANQEVERLALLYPAGVLKAEDVLAAVSDSARYSVADLVQAALRGETVRTIKIVQGLRGEAAAPVMVLWTLATEIRSGARAAEAFERGMAIDAALKSAQVWQVRVGALKQAMSRHTASSWLGMLSSATTLDRITKGHAPGDAWDELEKLCVQLSGNSDQTVAAAATL